MQRVLMAIGILVFSAAVACGQVASNTRDWPCFLGPTGDSKSAAVGIRPWPENGPEIVWQIPLGAGYCMPVVQDGKLYQFDRGPAGARLTCYDARNGERFWEFGYPSDYTDMYGYDNGPRCCPVVDGNRIYIYGVEGMLHCLDTERGEVVWKVDTMAQFGVIQNFFGVGSTPVVEGDLLIVQVGGSPESSRSVPPGQLDLVRPNGTAVVAFDKKTGEVRYTLGDDLASYSSPALATIDGRRWCFVWARNGLLAFEPSTGKLDFHFPWRARILESVNASNPVVVGELVFLSECYGPGSVLLKVKPGGYEQVWADDPRSRDKAMRTHWNTAIHHEGYLYGSSGRHSNEADLRCIELATGKLMWSEPGLSRSSLLYVDGHFVCLTEAGDLLLFEANPERFSLVSQVVLRRNDAGPFGIEPPRLLRYPAWAAPILADGLMYVRGVDRLVCLKLLDR